LRTETTASLVTALMAIGSLPLFGMIWVVVNLVLARSSGDPMAGDGLGLAMISLAAWGLAFLSFATGATYFGHRYLRRKLRPAIWQQAALAFCAIGLVTPFVFFLLG